jgi:hypothetical protein
VPWSSRASRVLLELRWKSTTAIPLPLLSGFFQTSKPSALRTGSMGSAAGSWFTAITSCAAHIDMSEMLDGKRHRKTCSGEQLGDQNHRERAADLVREYLQYILIQPSPLQKTTF